MSDLTKPRKQRNNVENIEDEIQKAVVSIIDTYIKKSGYTKRVFAEVYPKVSLSTLNNLYKPKYGRQISPRILKQLAIKISYMFGEVSAKDLYSELLNAAQIDISKYPFDKEDHNEDLLRTEMLFDFAELITNKTNPNRIKRREFIQSLINKETIVMMSGAYELVVDYTEQDLPINYWAIDTNMGNVFDGGYELKQTFLKILLDGSVKYPNDRVKYSFLTSDIGTFNMLNSIEIPALNLYLSAIYYDGNIFTERFIRTGKSPDLLVEKGLYIN